MRLKNVATIALSILLLIAAFWMVGAEKALHELGNFPLWGVVTILVLYGLNLVVVSYRLSRVLAHFGKALPASVVAKASISGLVAGLFFISLFGQVVGRHLVLRKFGVPSVLVASLTAYERSVLLLVSGGLCLLGASTLLDATTIANFLKGISVSEVALTALGGILLSLWLGRSRFEAQLIARTQSRATMANIMEIAVISLIGQLLVLATFVVGIYCLNPEVDLPHILAAAAVISFAASLPITVNGWGVRELAAVFIMGQLGIASSHALAVSILLGVCSTLVILAVSPFSLKKTDDLAMDQSKQHGNDGKDKLQVEKAAVWILSMAGAVLVFFQIHVPLAGGKINLNLADPFAILAIAALAVHAASIKQFPQWRVPKFNRILLVFSGLLIFSFLWGMREIGVTQWALAGRVMGWVVLLGYVSIGYLTVANMGSHGFRRLSETMIATAVMIVAAGMLVRLLNQWGWVDGLHIPLNFEGYAGNRNAFAFQLLVCSIFILAFSSLNRRIGDSARHKQLALAEGVISNIPRHQHEAGRRRLLQFSFLHGIILAGLVFSASRAGLITEAILLVTVWLARLADRRLIWMSLGFAALIWVTPYVVQVIAHVMVQAFAYLASSGGESFSLKWLGGIQSAISGSGSNNDRWETVVRGFEMWMNSPLLGAGLGVFIEKSTSWFAEPIVIHSTPVWILAEFGLLGMGIMIWAFARIARTAYGGSLTQPMNRVLMMLLPVFVLFGLVHEIFYQRIFWLVLGATCAVFGHLNSQNKARVKLEKND